MSSENDQHFDRLEIRGFRGLSELELDGFGRFNVLLGANDVGKTSVLEAMFLLGGFANLTLPERVQGWRNLATPRLDDLELLFHDLDVSREIDLRGQSDGGRVRRGLRIALERTEFDSRANTSTSTNGQAGDARSGSALARDGGTSSVEQAGPGVLRYEARVDSRKRKPVSFEGTLRPHQGGWQAKHSADPGDQDMVRARYVSPRPGYDQNAIGEVVVRKQTESLVRFLQAINPKVVAVATKDDVAFLDVGLERMLPLNVFGAGMVRAATILSYCLLGEDSVLLLDELENGLHHSAVRQLLKAVMTLSKDRDVQVFATTHSLGVLRSLVDVLSEEGFADHRSATHCFALQRAGDGRVRSYRYDHSQFEHCVRNGIEVR